jgi:hypothetical protein
MNNTIHFIDKVLAHLQPWIPLAQALVWPLFTLLLLWFFRNPVALILESVRKRIESGSAVKAGPFELAQLVPSTTKEFVEKRNTEIEAAEAAVQNEPSTEGKKEGVSAKELIKKDVRATYILAEELAMRKLASSLNLRIERDVRLKNSSFVFDGVALQNGRFTAIEIKFFRRTFAMRQLLKSSLDRLNTFFISLDDDAKRNFSVILAIVVGPEYGSGTSQIPKRASEVIAEFDFPIHIVTYELDALESEFEVT